MTELQTYDCDGDPCGRFDQPKFVLLSDYAAEVARLRGHVGWCVALLDALVAESKEQIEYGQEDAFRMGEWFTDEELGIIERARAASKPKP